MGIDTVIEYIAVAVGLLVVLGGLAVAFLRGGGKGKELPPEHRPPERPKGSTDHRSGTIVLDRPSDHAKPQAPPEAKGEQPPAAQPGTTTPPRTEAGPEPVTQEPTAPAEPAATAAPATAEPTTERATGPKADEDFTPPPSDEGVERARTAPPVTPAEPETATEPEAPAQPEAPTAPVDTEVSAAAEPELDTPAPTRDRMRALRSRLARSNGAIGKGLLALLSQGKPSEEDWEEVEDTLLAADLGIEPTTELVDSLRAHVSVDGTTDPEVAKDWLYADLLQLVDPSMDRGLAASRVGDRPACILVVGVNGTGKTTTVGKLARVLVANDRDVLLGAADTFRAAAADQLETWGARVGVPTVRSDREGADPAAVAFDAVKAAADTEVDAVIIDTAGRLHNKVGLMDELAKVKRVIEKQTPIDEVLLVLDATTGQNGLAQAKVFAEAVDVTGVVLTKLDGTAKGGIVVAVQRQLGVPVKLVGLGEGPDDLAPFVPEAFVDAIVG
ncbi:signal recognition particle-docking protein FtsY [Janibacter anophelis]|uniref:signal recognition particle-docking protein FtsY n=1 Tax=Janibacter anophelis TaxID=319054 RepID=UPI00082DC523|nr:signal recognition particle-docking protein FtsY [Janibacter anophelis]